MNYEKDIINYLIENNICENEEDAEYYASMKMHAKDALDAFLHWNGIIGYTNIIMQIVEDYTINQYTYIVKINEYTYIYRDANAWKACIARCNKKAKAQGKELERTTERRQGLGWVDIITTLS